MGFINQLITRGPHPVNSYDNFIDTSHAQKKPAGSGMTDELDELCQVPQVRSWFHGTETTTNRGGEWDLSISSG